MSMKLRDLIRKVRACKTAAEERAVIAKESAMIRTAIREEQVHYRHRNVAKLLFMHMLGYPTHFGQLECMKLTASPHFPEKRIGYLGMMLLLSEEADVLMLATNAFKNDLNSENKFVVGLSLSAIGNLATSDMSRDLAPEVDKHLKSPLSYIRKKSCLAMARCLSKCPDMVEDFVDRVVSLLKDKSHGVLVTVVQLMTQLLIIDQRNAEEEGEDPFQTVCRLSFLRLVPVLVKMLRNLLGGGFDQNDPFLQVQLLTLLRLLGANNEEASEEMNDVLAQVASNTETAKNAGNAILYECVLTIMGIHSDDGLRVLAVNILGRFLLNRDNNIRYVALNTLARCIMEQKQSGDELIGTEEGEANNAMSALQRHRTTVVDCLKDPDVSIRQRALELIYHLVNESNVESLTAELLNYLVLCPREHRSDICTRVLKVVDRYSPDERWRMDTLITILTIAGREATADVQSATVLYISRASAEVHAFCAHKLLKAIRDDDGSQHGLLSVGVWCIGEYGDMLLQPYTYTPTDSGGQQLQSITFMGLEPLAVIQAVDKVADRHKCPEFVRQMALTAYVKLSQRFSSDPAASSRLEKLIQKHQSSKSLELQLRSCEYNALLHATRGMKLPPIKKPTTTGEPDLFDMTAMSDGQESTTVSEGVAAAAREALVRMPAVDIKILEKRLASDDFGGGDEPRRARPAAAPQGNAGGGGDLLDLADMFGGAPAPAPQNGNLPTAPKSDGAGPSDMDLLSDIFAAQPVAAAPTSGGYDPFSAGVSNAAPSSGPANPLDLYGSQPVQQSAPPVSNDLFGAPPPQTTAAPSVDPFAMSAAAPSPASGPPASDNSFDIFGATPAPAQSSSLGVRVPGFTYQSLSVEFECQKPEPMNNQKTKLVAHFSNTGNTPIHGMNLQVAVPKYITMEMDPPSSSTVAPGPSKVTQNITVTNSMMGTKNLVLKAKVGFSVNGQKVEHMATCSSFPPGQY